MQRFVQKQAGWLLFALGAVLFAAGRIRGEHLTVLHKAIAICLQCIGIG
ncbi:MAG: CD1871A family CXXC motif-containing protein [Faecalibacterium sp.]